MTKLFLILIYILHLTIAVLLVAAPYFALTFGAVTAIMAVLAWGLGHEYAYTYLVGALYVYVGFAIFSVAFFMTYQHQNCCAGLQSFQSHLRHGGWKGVGMNVLEGLAWPWSWFELHQFQKDCGSSFIDAVLHACAFWFTPGGRELEMTSIDTRTGEVTTTHLKTPEEAQAALKEIIVKGMKKDM